MKGHNVYLYILVMAAVTYAIRALPLTLIRKEIRNPYIRSFIHYVPYATLAAMTFPSILFSTDSVTSAVAGFAVAILLSIRKKGLLAVASGAVAAVFLVQILQRLIL